MILMKSNTRTRIQFVLTIRYFEDEERKQMLKYVGGFTTFYVAISITKMQSR